LYDELVAGDEGFKIARDRNWSFVLLECDSKLVVEAFSNVFLVPWRIRNGWANCFHLFSQMKFHVSYIFREENHCADILAHYSFANVDHWWYHVLI
jgi:ribonuclease HI